MYSLLVLGLLPKFCPRAPGAAKQWRRARIFSSRRQSSSTVHLVARKAAQTLIPCGFEAHGQVRFRTAFVQQPAAVSSSLRQRLTSSTCHAQEVRRRQVPGTPRVGALVNSLTCYDEFARHPTSCDLCTSTATANFNVVHLPPVRQVCRLVSAGALREHLLDALDEPKMPRARHSGHLAIDLFWAVAMLGASSVSAALTLWERLRAVFASGALTPATRLMGSGWGSFWGGEKVRSRRQGSNSCHIGPFCPTADLRVRSIRARRHLYARRAARRRRRPDGPRPGRQSRRLGRPGRPLHRRSVDFSGCAPRAIFRSGTRVCTRVRPLARPAPPPLLPRCTARSPATLTAHPAPFAARAQALTPYTLPPPRAERAAARRPGRPLAGPSGPQRQPHARDGGLRGPRRLRQSGRRMLRARGTLGGPRGRRQVALRPSVGRPFGGDLAAREMHVVRGLQRPRGGSGRAGAGLAAGHGHAGAGCTAGDASVTPSSSPARAHVRTCHF